MIVLTGGGIADALSCLGEQVWRPRALLAAYTLVTAGAASWAGAIAVGRGRLLRVAAQEFREALPVIGTPARRAKPEQDLRAAVRTLRRAVLPIVSEHPCIIVGEDGCVAAAAVGAGTMLGGDDDSLAPGASLRTFVEEVTRHGAIMPMPAESPQQLVEAIVSSSAGSRDLQVAGDGWRRLTTFVGEDGSRTLVLTDITNDKRHTVALATANAALDAAVAHAAWRDSEMQATNARLDSALANMIQGLAMFDANDRLVTASPRFARMLRLKPKSVYPGIALARLARMSIDAGNHAGSEGPEEITEILAGRPARPEGNRAIIAGRMILIQRQPTVDGGSVVTLEDQTDRIRAEEQVCYMAHHDLLTGLANRSLLGQVLAVAVEHRSSGDNVAVLCLDLDRFKPVNDVYGHGIGDLLLKEVAARLGGCVRGGDTVARLGGDEFAIVLAPTKDVEEAARVAERIVAALAEPFVLDGIRVQTGTSVGVAAGVRGEISGEMLLEQADIALYRAKSAGRGTYCSFDPSMEEERKAKVAIEADLEQALDRGQIELAYCPVLSAATGDVVGLEAVLRWNHPERGVLAAESFLPVARRTGKAVAIGIWAIRTACAAAAAWPTPLWVSVPADPLQFKNASLAQAVSEAIAKAGIEAARLDVRIEEAVLLDTTQSSAGVLDALREMGVTLTLDGFLGPQTTMCQLLETTFSRIRLDPDLANVPDASEMRTCNALNVLLRLDRMRAAITAGDRWAPDERLVRMSEKGQDGISTYVLGSPVGLADVSALIHRASRRVRSELPTSDGCEALAFAEPRAGADAASLH